MTDVFSANASARPKKRRWSASFGIRGRLLGAFAAVASLTLLASLVAFVSYQWIGDSFRRTEQESIPAMDGALSLSRQAAEFSAMSAALLDANNPNELDSGIASLRKKREEMTVELNRVTDSAASEALGANLRALDASVDQLTSAVQKRLKLADDRRSLVEGAQSAYRVLAEKISPVLDDAQFNLQIGLSSISDSKDLASAAAAAHKLGDKEAASLQALSDLRAESNLVVGLFIEASRAERDLLTPLHDQVIASIGRAERAAFALGDEGDAPAIQAALAVLVAYGKKGHDVLEARGAEFDELKDEREIVIANASKSRALAQEVREFVDKARLAATSAMASSDAVVHESQIALAILVLSSMLASLAIAWLYIGRGVLSRLAKLHHAILSLASGDLEVNLPDKLTLDRDELGDMARAVRVFRENGVEKARVEAQADLDRRLAEEQRRANDAVRATAMREQVQAVEALAEGLTHLANGDLTYRLPMDFAQSYAKLRDDFNTSLGKLQAVMSAIEVNARSLRSASGDISQANEDLSKRTDRQAKDLEGAATALEQVTTTVNKSAVAAGETHDIVSKTKREVSAGSEVVRGAVSAMDRIHRSSTQISEIIVVIDEIALQTNLLALNAGVEAARAGEFGRGFAVVAAEVRALARRSAEAAKEIKGLIVASTTQIDEGVTLVSGAGSALERILAQVGETDRVVSEIAAAAKQQAIALQAVNTSVNQMERMTQQNAAMVQQTAVAGNDLALQTEDLVAMVGHFRTRQVGAEDGLIERPADANSSARIERDATRRTPVNVASRRVRRASGAAHA